MPSSTSGTKTISASSHHGLNTAASTAATMASTITAHSTLVRMRSIMADFLRLVGVWCGRGPSQCLADVTDVGLRLLPDLCVVAAEDQLSGGQREALDLFDSGVRWYGEGARIGDEVDQRGARVG